uniref:UBX domain-containing protein n=2 Tax=Caenorhabditis japonica TaxID=281687 RepID=A0A8R1HWI5_CAEJA
MQKFKNFLKKKKVQGHFMRSGEGVRLGEPSSSSGAPAVPNRDAAAAAALRRMEKNQPEKPEDASRRRIQMIAKRELEEDQRRKLEELTVSEPRERAARTEQEPEKELEHSSAISKVMYTSELIGEDHVALKVDLLKDIEHFLLEQVRTSEDDSDKVIAAVLMLYSLNVTNKKQLAIDTICKYCQNILENPEEDKFKKIRLSNKAFQDRVNSAIGGRSFLEAVGFTEQTEGDEQFLVFTRESDTHLVEALDALRNGEAVPIKVARNMELLKLKQGQKPKAPKLADEFYNLSAAELKSEQRAKEQQVEKMLTLRTKEMRQKDEQLTSYRYKYTLIRIRLPGNILLQGVFGCQEPFSAVRGFVAGALNPNFAAAEFNFHDGIGQVVDDESATLAQLSLAPAALLHIVLAENPADDELIVADEYVSMIQELE